MLLLFSAATTATTTGAAAVGAVAVADTGPAGLGLPPFFFALAQLGLVSLCLWHCRWTALALLATSSAVFLAAPLLFRGAGLDDAELWFNPPE